jgi:hypothetical protein
MPQCEDGNERRRIRAMTYRHATYINLRDGKCAIYSTFMSGDMGAKSLNMEKPRPLSEVVHFSAQVLA